MQRSLEKLASHLEWHRFTWGLLAAIAVTIPAHASARPAATVAYADASSDAGQDGDDGALPYLQCVPFARQTSGIQLFGDAHSWWDQAAGHYARGHEPKVGAVMSFRPHAAMQLGHVATVSRIIDTRTVLLRHANWSPIDGKRGQVELDVRAVDVSPANDWSEVRVWYAPIGDLGTTRWPVNGFIYKTRPGADEERNLRAFRPPTVLAAADRPRMTRLNASYAPAPAKIDSNFLDEPLPERSTGRAQTVVPVPRMPARNYLVAHSQIPSAAPATVTPALRDDPIGRIIAQRMARHES